jgi:uncharacterized SAM-binding protein YcdF (DUF218 family)
MSRDDAEDSVDERRRSRRRGRSGVFPLLLLGAVLYLAGFGFFLTNLPQPGIAGSVKADAIVALTGEGDRLTPAVALLEEGDGQRLLITGVNKATTKRELKAILHGGSAFDCCADLGFAAADTRGNAEEAAQWAADHGYKSLIVVTAAYHMPRSLLEFGERMPDVTLVPFAVPGDMPNPTAGQNIRRLHGEYAKFLASLARALVNDLMRKTNA